MDLSTQFKNLLNGSFVGEEERNEWIDLVPVLKEGELKELISLFEERREMTGSLTSKIKELTINQPSSQQNPIQQNITAEDISRWSVVQLSDREMFLKLKNLSERIVRDDDVGAGADLFRILKELLNKNPKFKEENQSLVRDYDLLMAKLAYFALPSIEGKDIDELFGNYLLLGLNSEDIDFRKRMDLRFMLYHDEVNDGAERKRILRAIKGNIESIGKEKIEISGEERPFPPTIKNWIRDYELPLEGRKARTTVEQVTYLNQSKNARKLSEEERSQLLKVLSFYDSLLFFGAVQEVRAREIKRSAANLPKSEAPVFSPEDIEKKYQDNLGDEGEIKKAEEEVLQSIKDSGLGTGDILSQEIFSKGAKKILNKNKIVASLKVAAGRGELGNLLSDNRFLPLVEKYLNQKNLSQALNDFKINPIAPNNLVFLLRYILEDLLKLSEEKSAGIGIQLVNLMKKNGENKYNNIVYFDESKGGFVWAD